MKSTRTQLIRRHKWFQRVGRSVACDVCIGREIRSLGQVDKRPKHCRVASTTPAHPGLVRKAEQRERLAAGVQPWWDPDESGGGA